MKDHSPRYKATDLIQYWNHCWYCGVELEHHNPRNTGRAFSRDHVVPRSKGGQLTVPACCDCNHLKDDLNLEEFRIVFFGGHLGEFHGETQERKLKERGIEALEPLRNFAIQRAMEKYLKKTGRVLAEFS